jgi:hypothetical protein
MLGLVCAASVGCGSALQGRGWLEVRTSHFDLHTDLIEPAALDMARALEESRAALLSVAWQGAPDPRGRTEVVVFASEDRFREYVRRDNIDGLAQSALGSERLIAAFWEDERPAGLPRVVVHEIAHDLSHWFTPLQPAWYSEGMASFLEGLEYDRAKQRAILGGVPEPMVHVLESYRRSTFGVEGLFAATSPHQDSDRATSRFYFTSWLLVHWLINHHGDVFRQFQSDLSTLADWREAWSVRFPILGPAELDAGLERYMDGGRFEYLSAKVQLPPFSPRVRALSPAEGHGLSSWIAHRLGADDLSARDMESALALDRNELRAQRTRYGRLGVEKDAAERRSLARELVQAHPESGEAWLTLAQSGESDSERFGALEQARRLAPDHPGVIQLLAERALDFRDHRAGMAHAQVLIRRTAPSAPILKLYVTALAQAGRCETARRFVRNTSADYLRCVIQENGRRMRCPVYFERLIEKNCTPDAAAPPTHT